MSAKEQIADMGEEARRQHAVVEALGRRPRYRRKISARPEKIIRLRDHHPRRKIIEAEKTLDRCWNFDPIGRVSRAAVRNRNDGDDFSALDHLLSGDDGARAVLNPLLCALVMFRCPEVRIADHKTRTWCR